MPVTRYQPDKDYQEIQFNPSRKLLAAELNELQDIAQDFRRNITQASFGEGNQGQNGFKVIQHPTDNINQIMILPGWMYVDKYKVYLDASYTYDNLTTPGIPRVDYVWAIFTRTVIDSTQDPNIEDGGAGETSSRILLEVTFDVQENTTALPASYIDPTTQWLVLLGVLNRVASNLVTAAMIEDRRRFWWDTYVEEGLDLVYGAGTLTPDYTSGRAIVASTRYQIPSGTFSTMLANSTGYAYIDEIGGVQLSLTSLPDDSVSGKILPLYRLISNGTICYDFQDLRKMVGGNPLIREELTTARAQFDTLNERMESTSGVPWLAAALVSTAYSSTFVDLGSRIDKTEYEISSAWDSSYYGDFRTSGGIDGRFENIEQNLYDAQTSTASGSAIFGDLDARFENIEEELVASHTSDAYASSGLTSSFARLDDRMEYGEELLIATMTSTPYASTFVDPQTRIEYTESDVVSAHFGISAGTSNEGLKRYLGCAGVATFRSGDAASGYVTVDYGANFAGLNLGTDSTFTISVPSSADQVGEITYEDSSSGFDIYNSGGNYWSNFRWHFFASYT